jgi:membrane protein DedA with SNARE-associated domain
VIATATLAAIAGDNCGYMIGRRFGLPLVERHGGRVGLSTARLRIGQYLFLHHGGKIVLFGRFVAFLRCFAALLAGVNRMRWPHFLTMNALGALCWATLFGGAAYLLGSQIERVAGSLGFGLLVVAVLCAIAGIVFFRRHEHELMHRADLALSIRKSKSQASRTGLTVKRAGCDIDETATGG